MTKLLFSLFIFFSSNIVSQIVFDTISTKTIGPGVQYYKIKCASPVWSIDLTTVDLHNQFTKLEVIKANDRLSSGREKTSAISTRKNAVGHWSVAAVNGDFFDGNGNPVNIQISGGEILRKERPDYPAFGVNIDNNISISKPTFTGKVFARNSQANITGINEARGDNAMILFNHYFGTQTNTNAFGSEVILSPLNSFFVNDTMYCRVDTLIQYIGNAPLTSGKFVLSGHGVNAPFLNNNFAKGDTIKFLVEALPSIKKVREMIGGHPIVVANGAVANMNSSDPFVTARHPRTAVGVNSDSSKLFLLTVDGRQTLSVGMNLFELADFMLRIGVYQGMNLDGGGSTTMVARNKVMNSPSDATGERDVANALLLVSTAPLGNLNQIISPIEELRIFRQKNYQFTFEGIDEYYNPIPIVPTQLTYTLTNPNLGTISNSGLFTASTQSDSGYLIVSLQSAVDTIKIVVKGIDHISISPKNVITDKFRIITFTTKVYDSDGVVQSFAPQSFTWVCTDTTIGKIDIVGQFQGKNSGTAKIISSILGFSDTATVLVQIFEGNVLLETFESMGNWILTTTNVDTTQTSISISSNYASNGTTSLKIDYGFTYQAGLYYWVYLNNEVEIPGVPDSLSVDILSDGANHRVFFDVMDNNNNAQRIYINKIANHAGVFEKMAGKVPANLVFPVRLKAIAIPLGSQQVNGQSYSGTIYLDNLRVIYPAVSSINDGSSMTTVFDLLQNYPNPFNSSTNIEFFIPESELASLEVFDILGNHISTLVNEKLSSGNHVVKFNSTGLPAGVYFYRLKSSDLVKIKKLIVLN